MVFDKCFVTDSKLLHFSAIFCCGKRKSCTFAASKINHSINNYIDRALKRYKRKYEKTGVVKELRARQQFTKPSVIKRAQLMKAIYVQKLRQAEENM